MKTLTLTAVALLLAACGNQPATAPTQAAAGANSAAAAPVEKADAGNAATADTADIAAAGQTGRCVVESIPANEVYEGPCVVDTLDDAVAGRSFVATPPAGKRFPLGMTEVIIQADTPTDANLSVRTPDGELSDGDIARRDGNCWKTETDEICVTRN